MRFILRGFHKLLELDLKKIRWLTIIIPFLGISVLEGLRLKYESNLNSTWLATLIYLSVIILGVVIFSVIVFSYVNRTQRKLTSQKERFKVLFHITKALNSSLDRDTMFQRALDVTRERLKGDYAEILVKENGETKFWYSGIDRENCPVKEIPKLRGLKAEALKSGEVIRLKDRKEHPKSVPLPENHPPIGPLICVPVRLGGRSIAHIILARKTGSLPFTKDDEETLLILADELAVAIERELLYRKTQEIAVLKERDRIARDLHDGLVQILGYLNLNLYTIEENLSSGKDFDIKGQLREVRNVVRDAYEEVRKAIFEWKVTKIPEKSLKEEVENYAREFSLQNNIRVRIRLDGLDSLDMPLKAKLQFLRIVQEALNNVRKHARASEVRVEFESKNGIKRLIIEDDGKGFNLEKLKKTLGEPHFGLQTMKERAESIGGKLIIRSALNRGTKIMVEFLEPLTEVSDGANQGAIGG
jgi:nitrate/nitrite-specific signal transduction histidine kinase